MLTVEQLLAPDDEYLFTEWPEIKAVTPAQYKELMRTPLVYDGRNLYTLQEMKDAGIEYYSIGR